MKSEFTPKLFTVLKEGISRERFLKDVLSGLIVGIVALPLCIAFAIASGVSPEKGLITGIIAGVAISAFGGSRVQIGGPTGAFIVIVYGIVQEYGAEGLTIATFLAGFLLMLMGLLQFGRLLKYFPYTLITGFTSGIAVIIFSSQVKDLLGLQMGEVPASFIEKWAAYAGHFDTINPYALAIGAGTILVTLLFGKVTTKIPGSLVAIIAATAVAYSFHLPVDTIGSRFGEIPNKLPPPRLYAVNLETIRHLLQPALAIALLGGIESLLSAVVADGMIGGRHRSNMELIAQGGANIFSAMFGGIPATGAIARTATNIKNGGRTPIAGIVHALTLLAIMAVASPLAKHIPLACLAGILAVVAYNMSELHAFFSIFKTTRYDVAVMLATFFLTVVFDLVIAIEIGMVLAAFLFMKRMADATSLGQSMMPETPAGEEGQTFEQELQSIPREILIYEINGPLFFGAAQKFSDTLKNIIGDQHKVLILRMRSVPMIDATGLQRLGEIISFMKARRVQVILSGVNEGIRQQLDKQGILDSSFIRSDVQDALSYAAGLKKPS
ncbi:MAG: STAS domain-containing protein [Phaeodactylibacter sp.]|nr:STAS domain-containing protein [Phaeodactylibacter sp.]MCB9274910.1 STAS domain-containing protein [Lewinellaceae bacterium]